MEYKTEQEAFWSGDFGDDYSIRNTGADMLASNTAFFARALGRARGAERCIEFGANVGSNLMALKCLFPWQIQHAIEINQSAADALAGQLPQATLHRLSILDYAPEQVFDLVLIKGVLIHINPEYLPQVYEKLVASCCRYLLVAEYYNSTPVEVSYRGHTGRLFKRDFCGEILGAYPEMKLLDYGFVYRRDPLFPQDDLTWFLMEKVAAERR